MGKEKLLIGKPRDTLRELNAVLAFEQEHPIILTEPSGNFGDIKENLYLIRDSDVIDSCYIEGNSDIRSCILSFPELKEVKSRKIVKLATDHALLTMKMQEAFVIAEKEDKSMIQTLNRLGYESLGLEGERETFVQDQEIRRKERESTWRL